MKQIILTLVTGLTIISSYGQERKDLVISLATGKLTSPYYSTSKAGMFFSADFDYHLTKRGILSANYTYGGHDYYDKILSNDPDYIKSDGTNAKAEYQIFSILYKYKLLDTKLVSGTIGTGAGIMAHSRQYPFKTSNVSSFRESVWTDLVFPMKFELDYNVSKSFRLGLIGGFYIHPDYPVLAYHAGARIGYVIR